MENSDQTVKDEPVGRRTRSGKSVPPVKPAGKKTRKKVMLVEVEVSDDEDVSIGKSQDEKSDENDITINSSNNLDESNEANIDNANEVEIANTDAIEEIISINTSDDAVADETNVVINGSENKVDLCAIVENDVVFEYDFEKQNVLDEVITIAEAAEDECENKPKEDNDIISISEVISTNNISTNEIISTEEVDEAMEVVDTDKLETVEETVVKAVVTEPMDVDEVSIIEECIVEKVDDETEVIAEKVHDETEVIAEKVHGETEVIAEKVHDETAVIAEKVHNKTEVIAEKVHDKTEDIAQKVNDKTDLEKPEADKTTVSTCSEKVIEEKSVEKEVSIINQSESPQKKDTEIEKEAEEMETEHEKKAEEMETEHEKKAEEMETEHEKKAEEGKKAEKEKKDTEEKKDIEEKKDEEEKKDAEGKKDEDEKMDEDKKMIEEEKKDGEEKKSEEEKKDKITIQSADPDAENISEDELPTVQVAKVPETEEVSDEELPGPKRAELPADTEVVSEDELPAVKKEGTKRKLAEGDYDPGSPTSESEVSAKKPFLDPEAEKEKEKVDKPKKLPELDKYWKAVNDDPADFTGWTYLLQYVDQENDMEAAREAYDAFLSHYPYCYGYWRKYADYEKRKGNKKKCEEVFERGLKAIPLSVDLWIHYLTYVRTTKPEDEEFTRAQFERALAACGLEFRSDRLWDSFIKWETEGKRPQQATALYDRLLATPTQGYTTHFDNFQEHVSSNPPNKILEVDEFLALRKEVKHMLKHDVTSEAADKADAPPGEDTEEVSSDEETKAIRERIISIRRKIHKNTVTAVTGRWNFEEGIKRPYFHVKPLERCQLKNWQEYLDYEVEHGEQPRIIVLFERCLIACALYEEFWLRFVHYLEGLKDPELHSKIKDVYERACTIHHIKKPNLHLQWAMFEESIKNYNKAAEILANIEKSVPNLLQVANRRINLERRREDYEKCSQLYEHYILNSKNKVISTNLAVKYARFSQRIVKNVDKSLEVLNSALSKDPNNPRIYLQLIDMTMQKDSNCEKEIMRIIDNFLEKESSEIEQKVLFAQRKLEFLEDFGSDIQCVQSAYDDYQKYIKQSKEAKKKETKSDTVGKKEKNPPLPSSQASTYANYGSYGNSSSTGPYQYSSSQQGQYNYSQYGQGDQYQYGNWQYPQGGYSGYNQWSGYSGGYGY